VATRASSSESMIRKPSSGLDATTPWATSPGGASVCRHRLLPPNSAGTEHALVTTNGRPRHSPPHKGARSVPTREGPLVPRANVSHAGVDRQVRQQQETLKGRGLTASTRTLAATDRARSPPAWVRALLGTVTGRIGTEPCVRRTIPLRNDENHVCARSAQPLRVPVGRSFTARDRQTRYR
jgi:hypothetical protein